MDRKIIILPDEIGHYEIRRVDGDERFIAETARTSFNSDVSTYSDDQVTGLINYLLRHDHTSPFEHAKINLMIRINKPIQEQCLRHRTARALPDEALANAAVQSYRFKNHDDDYYFPSRERLKKSKKGGLNKQSPMVTEEMTDEAVDHALEILKEAASFAEKSAKKLAALGFSNEIIRMPKNDMRMVSFAYSQDLHNFIKFIKVRQENSAQYEVRVLADSFMEEIIRPYFPTVYAFHFG